MLIHPARMPLLEPGGYTAFRSPSNSNMLTHPARGQVNDGGQTISGYTAVASPGGATASVTVAGAAINQVPFRTPPHTSTPCECKATAVFLRSTLCR